MRFFVATLLRMTSKSTVPGWTLIREADAKLRLWVDCVEDKLIL